MPFCVAAALCLSLPLRRSVAEETNPAKAPEGSAPSTSSNTRTHEDITRWVGELSHDEFTIRQAAASQLLAAGMPARQPLLEIVNGSDPETRAAARRLVALIDRTEFHRRLEAFATDSDGRQGLTLPGWEQFQKLVGSAPATRALFVDMQKQEGAILSAVFGVSKRAPEDLWEARLLRIAQWQSTVGDRTATPPLGSCAAMLFLGSVAEMNVSDTSAALIENLIQRPPLREALQVNSSQDAVRKLVVGWLLNCPNKNEDILQHRLNLIATTGIEEALPLALAVVDGGPQYEHLKPLTKAVAVLVIGQLGKREHADRLEPLLEDSTVCLPFQGQVPGQPAAVVQVRDVALVIMVHLTKQQPSDYGYLNARLQPPRSYQLQSLFRENDQQRTEAIAKWRQWRAAHKDDGSNAKVDSPPGTSTPPK